MARVPILTCILFIILAISVHAIDIAPERFWLSSDGVPVYIPYATTQVFEGTQLPDINRVAIVMHHGGRDAMTAFEIVSEVVQASQAGGRMLTVCPQLLKPQHVVENPQLDPGVLAWEEEWFYNGSSVNPNLPPTLSYTTVDSLVHAVIQACPNLEVLVFSGHAGGGKFFHRHAMVSTIVDDHPDIEFLYHFGNCGGYAYLTEERYDLDLGEFITPSTGLDTTGCSLYDYWPFGLSNVPEAQAKRDRYESRNIVMMIGLQDTTIRGLNCQMDFQTPNSSRLEMADLYWEHTQNVYGALPTHHLFVHLPNVGHIIQQFYSDITSRHILINLMQDHVVFSRPGIDPPVIPASGGELPISVYTFNSSWNELTVDMWSEIQLPTNNIISPLQLRTVSIPAASFLRSPLNFAQTIPGAAPSGVYIHKTKMGIYPDTVFSRSRFNFAKLPENGPEADSHETMWPQTVDGSSGFSIAGNAALADEYILHPIYPNPFNSFSTVRVTLPESSILDVIVFNTLGERVLSLADGVFDAGTHTFPLHASELSSGLYLVRADVPGQWTDVRKVLLMK